MLLCVSFRGYRPSNAAGQRCPPRSFKDASETLCYSLDLCFRHCRQLFHGPRQWSIMLLSCRPEPESGIQQILASARSRTRTRKQVPSAGTTADNERQCWCPSTLVLCKMDHLWDPCSSVIAESQKPRILCAEHVAAIELPSICRCRSISMHARFADKC